ncbi:MAG TPA: bacteriohopanetetrol glucosamine biosynthesis glycosyltransferase HpnI [Rhizomicrobium sp.]|jgi:ceramide glucosyltransferase
MEALADVMAVMALVGSGLCIAGWLAVQRFAVKPPQIPAHCPPVTILKPLCGEEPHLEEALVSCLRQDYPEFQIVFGLHHRSDPALAVVENLKVRFPDCDMAIIVNPAIHGTNRKVSNLINMLSAARHNLLVISDSDLHVPPDYLGQLVAELERPGTGLVTCLALGRPPAELGWPARLGAAQITYNFVPGILFGRAAGRQDSLGSTVMLFRDTLERAGGLNPLADVLAEDNVLGQRVNALGLSVGLAQVVAGATVPENSLAALWHHELRWARTIRASAPWCLAGSAIQYPLFWAALACVFSGGALWSIAAFAAIWALRAAAMRGIDVALKDMAGNFAPGGSALLLPLRDCLSAVVIAASYWTEDVVWRGHKMRANGVAAAEAP